MSLISSLIKPRLQVPWLASCVWLALSWASPSQAWNFGLSADYFADMQGTNPVSSFGFSGSNSYQETYRVFISQSVLKRFYIYPDEPELDFADTALGISAPLPDWVEDYSLSWSASATLPTSEYSRRHEIYSKPQASLSASRSYMDKKLGLQYGTYFRLFLSRYDSEATGHGRGGRPLPIMSYGISHSGSYKISEAYSAAYSLAYNETRYHSLDPVASEAVRAIDLPDQTYAVSFSASWAATEAWSWSLGLTQGSQIIHAGTVDLVLYDEDRSQWFVSTRYSF